MNYRSNTEHVMIIDCHGHYTTAPPQLGEYREKQKKELLSDPHFQHQKGEIIISDDELRASVESAQLKLQKERGIDRAIFSPRASWMGHHIGNATTSKYWTEHCNELIYRLTQLYPNNFIGGCQLPQIPNGSLQNSILELERCVNEFGFVSCNLNLDPSGGHWNSPPLGDQYWYPFYEKMVELDIPAMIHVSGCCNPAFHATGSYYLSADTTAFMQLMTSTVCADFPTIKFIIPHGGGAVPFHWGRFRGLADMMKLPDLDELLMNNVFFDTCVYHQPGIDLLVDVIDTKNILFASEMIGAVRGIDPQTGHYFDDTKRYIDNNQSLSEAQKQAIFSGNAMKVFSRLSSKLGDT